LSIKKQLYGAIALVLVVVLSVVGSSFFCITGIGGLKKDVQQFQDAKTTLVQAKELQLQVSKVWQFITDASLTKDRKVIDQEAKPAYDKAVAIIAQLQSQQRAGSAGANVEKLRSSLPAMWQTGVRMFDAYQRDWQAGNVVMEEFDKACDGSIAAVDAVVDLAEKHTGSLEKEMTSQLNRQRQTMVATSAIALLAALALTALMFALLCSISRSLSRLTLAVREVAQGDGDLTKRLDESGKDELSEVCRCFNLFLGKIHGIISQASHTTVQVAAAAEQLSSSSGEMAVGAEAVASQAGTAATAGEEMAATSCDIAKNCHAAASGAQTARKEAENGAVIVEKTVTAMSEISLKVIESARTVERLGARGDQIGAIVETIQDIADQTNLLALNAAIEAARAGEQGRGFAVVADEVRALAERTTRATKEIAEMIRAIQSETKEAVVAMEEGVRQVEAGRSEAAQSGAALERILDQVNGVSMQVEQIATAAEQQTATTNEISGGMQQINEVAREMASATHHSSSSAGELALAAQELRRLVGHFKLA
jgi:methyl-accepting chemotaxis protein